ncbi:MAG: hypothetical protein AAB840_02040 [Patescibacteria group bacterium]
MGVKDFREWGSFLPLLVFLYYVLSGLLLWLVLKRIGTHQKKEETKITTVRYTIGDVVQSIRFYDEALGHRHIDHDFMQMYHSVKVKLTETIYRETFDFLKGQDFVVGSLFWLNKEQKLGPESLIIFEEMKDLAVSQLHASRNGA